MKLFTTLILPINSQEFLRLWKLRLFILILFRFISSWFNSLLYDWFMFKSFFNKDSLNDFFDLLLSSTSFVLKLLLIFVISSFSFMESIILVSLLLILLLLSLLLLKYLFSSIPKVGFGFSPFFI